MLCLLIVLALAPPAQGGDAQAPNGQAAPQSVLEENRNDGDPSDRSRLGVPPEIAVAVRDAVKRGEKVRKLKKEKHARAIITAWPTDRIVDVEFADGQGNLVKHPGCTVVRVDVEPARNLPELAFLASPDANFIERTYKPGDRIVHNYGVVNDEADGKCPIRVTAFTKTWITHNSARGLQPVVKKVEYAKDAFSRKGKGSAEFAPDNLVVQPGEIEKGHLLIFETMTGVAYDVIYSSFRYEYETVGDDCAAPERNREISTRSFVVDY